MNDTFFFSAPQLKRGPLGSPIPTPMRVISLCLVLLSACGAPARTTLTGEDLIGRWEFDAATNRSGEVIPAWMRLTLFIVGITKDSVHGGAIVYLDVKQPLDDRPCGILRGSGGGRGQLSLVIFTIDEPSADMMIEASVRNDSMLVTSLRPRDGENALGAGVWLVFRRVSTDARTGCLTSA